MVVIGMVAVGWGCSSPDAPLAATPVGITSEPPPPSLPSPAAPESVRYRVEFDGLWSQQTHPQDYPGNPHFSPLIGATHTAAVSFWREGGLASDGIKQMAEQGLTSPLDSEIAAATVAGTARDLVRGSGIPLSPATVAVEFDAHQTHPLLTLVSMVAPSPDWFVGVSGLPLFASGQWVDLLAIDLLPWDAGTDGGRSYESPDLPLSPRISIARLLGFPVATNGEVRPMARYTIRRQ